MTEETIVRENLMTQKGYMPYCGADHCKYRNPRVGYNHQLKQFECICGWISKYPEDFIKRYEEKWEINKLVYVGTMEFGYGRMKMFHMASINIEALHKMADKIGIQRKWFQNDKGNEMTPHYDVCKSKKYLAIQNGAVEINDRLIVKLCYPELQKMLRE